MTFKRIVSFCLALCTMATFTVALCGCEDLGAYEDTEEYYNSFDDIVLISGTSKEQKSYSVKNYFYNKESREKFLAGEDGAYKGVEYSDYVYMAIPFESNIDMDTLALFIQSQNDTTVYINVFLSDKIPSNWKAVADNEINQDAPEEDSTASSDETEAASSDETEDETEAASSDETDTVSTEEAVEEEQVYDDPDPETRIGEAVVHLKKGKWGSFVLDLFNVNGETQKSIQINDGQYILLQIRNNSGVRVFDDEKQAYVDPQTGLELQKTEITMTNLLIRALDITKSDEQQQGE